MSGVMRVVLAVLWFSALLQESALAQAPFTIGRTTAQPGTISRGEPVAFIGARTRNP